MSACLRLDPFKVSGSDINKLRRDQTLFSERPVGLMISQWYFLPGIFLASNRQLSSNPTPSLSVAVPSKPPPALDSATYLVINVTWSPG